MWAMRTQSALKNVWYPRNPAGRFGKPRVESGRPTPRLGILGGVPGVGRSGGTSANQGKASPELEVRGPHWFLIEEE